MRPATTDAWQCEVQPEKLSVDDLQKGHIINPLIGKQLAS